MRPLSSRWCFCIDRYSYKPAKRLELVAFKPTLNMLPEGQQSRYEQHFQNTLFEDRRKRKYNGWWSRRSDTRWLLTPLTDCYPEIGEMELLPQFPS